MFDLFSLAPASHFNHIMAKDGQTYVGNSSKMIDSFYWTPFVQDELDAKSPYTLGLSALIERCMHAEPSRRPTPTELLEATAREMNNVYTDPESTLPYSIRNRKLYYRGNEINDMTIEERNCGRWFDPYDWSSLHAPGNNDPNDPRLDIYPDLMWEMRKTKENREAVEKHFREDFDEVESDGAKFQDHLLKDTQRIKLRSTEIEIIDIDNELTLDGTLDQHGFLARYEAAKRPPSAGGQTGNDNGNNNDDDDDDGNNDDNDNPGGAPVQAAGVQAPPPSKSGAAQVGTRKQPARGAKKAGGEQNNAADGANLQAAADGKQMAAPQGFLHGGRSYVLGQSGSPRYRTAKYEPYIGKEAHSERFANTKDGKDLIFVVDTAPYPNYKVPKSPSPQELRTSENSQPSRMSIASSTYGDGVFRPRVRSVFVATPDEKGSTSRKRRRSSETSDEVTDSHRPRKNW